MSIQRQSAKRPVVRFLSFIVALLFALVSAERAMAETQTFTYGGGPINLTLQPLDSGPSPVNSVRRQSPYPATITVSGVRSSARIVDLNVTLTGLTHTQVEDLDILLVGPQGCAILMSDVNN